MMMVGQANGEGEEVELVETHSELFHEHLVSVCMEIVADCKKVVEVVNSFNAEDEQDTEQMKEVFVQAVKRVPQSSGRLVEMTGEFIKENSEFYEDDDEYANLFRLLQAHTRSVKESVQALVRLATVSVWRTRSAATTAKTQQLLETHCKKVALAIKKLMAADDQLKLMEEEEEESWIAEESDQLAKLLTAKTVQLAKEGSSAIKELVDAAHSATREEAFVETAKATLFALNQLLEFAAALNLEEEQQLKRATLELITSAKLSFQARSTPGAASLLARLDTAKEQMAEAVRRIVLSSRSLNTEQIVRARLALDDADPIAPAAAGKPPGSPGPARLRAQADGSAATSNAPAGSQQQQLVRGILSKDISMKQIQQLRQMQQHLQEKRLGKKGTLLKRRPTPGSKPKAEEQGPAIDLVRYQRDMTKVLTAQKHVRRWLRINRFRNIANSLFSAPEFERLRKRNMALWEIVSTERIYVSYLEDLEKTIITPLRSSSHSFITEREVGLLFSNLESIICLNIQILEMMEERMDKWPSDCHFADIFVKKAPVLRLYTEYLNNYERQVKTLTELEKKPAFVAYIKSCKSKMNLSNYLILPVQRLPRYEILLEGLLKYTEEGHVDYKNINLAIEKVKDLNVHVDKKKKDEDNRRAIQELQKQISGVGTLYVAHRQLVREGYMDVVFPNKKKEPKLYVFLFSDMLLVTRPKGKGKGSSVSPSVERPKTKLKETIYFKDGYILASEMGPGFRLQKLPDRSFSFVASSDIAKEKWMRDIETCLKEEAWKKILY